MNKPEIEKLEKIIKNAKDDIIETQEYIIRMEIKLRELKHNSYIDEVVNK